MGRRATSTQVFDGVALFDGGSRRRLAQIAPHTDRMRLPGGTVLAEAGRTARELIVLLDGVAGTDDGSATGTLAAGQAVAPAAVATAAPFPATVTADGEVEVLVINGPAFRWALHEIPGLAHRVRPPGPARRHLGPRPAPRVSVA